MLTIRLRRTGAKRDPHYRVVVIDRKAGRDGPFIEILGHYHPRRQPAEVMLDMDRTRHWVGRGARMSDTVRSLYRGIETGRIEPGLTGGGGSRDASEAGVEAPSAADATPASEVAMDADAATEDAPGEDAQSAPVTAEPAEAADLDAATDDGADNAGEDEGDSTDAGESAEEPELADEVDVESDEERRDD